MKLLTSGYALGVNQFLNKYLQYLNLLLRMKSHNSQIEVIYLNPKDRNLKSKKNRKKEIKVLVALYFE